MTTVQEAVREGSSPETPTAKASPESAQRARSITLPSAAAFDAVTQRVRKTGQFAARGAALLDRPGSLVHSQPPTFRQSRDRHHECANHYQTWPIVRWLRLTWGYFHLLAIKPALNLLEWVTESPFRLLIAVIIGTVIWFFG